MKVGISGTNLGSKNISERGGQGAVLVWGVLARPFSLLPPSSGFERRIGQEKLKSGVP